MNDSKKNLRNEMILRRKNLSTIYRDKFSTEIVQKFLRTDIYKNSSNIMAYMSMREEVQLREIFENVFAQNKKISLPIIIERGIIKPAYLPNFEALEVGEFNILTVKKNLREFVDIKKIDCVIVPGVAFDIHGKRLGMGGGYYDRFLKLTSAKKIALAFDFQIIDDVPTELHDISVDLIITERRIIKCL